MPFHLTPTSLKLLFRGRISPRSPPALATQTKKPAQTPFRLGSLLPIHSCGLKVISLLVGGGSSITHSHADDRFFSAYLITMIMFIFKVVIITFHRAFSLRSLRATGKKKPRGWEGFFRRVSSHHWKPDDGVRLTMRWVSLGLLGSGVCRPLLLGPPETSDGLC